MNRNRTIVVTTLLILFAVLFASWVFLFDVDFPIGEWGRPSSGHHHARVINPDTDAAFRDSPDAGDADTRGNRPLEIPDEPRRVAQPPQPMETAPPPVEEAEGRKAKVEAVLKPGEPDVAGGEKEFDLQRYIVSTLYDYPERYPAVSHQGGGLSEVSGKDPFQNPFVEPDFGYLLQGHVKFPELGSEDTERLRSAHRLQAWVYLPDFPDSVCAVNPARDTFVLQLTKNQARDYRRDGLRVMVHSPAFRIEGGAESTVLKRNGEAAPQIKLELAPVYKLVVRVTPAGALESGVRAWVERRGVDCPIDDSLYMSANVPPSGELVFHVPEHYGELRIGVTGAEWHSGLPQLVSLSDWNRTSATVNIECASEPCDKISGQVGAFIVNSADPEGPEKFQSYGVARLEDTSYGYVMYSNEQGDFSGYVPYAASTSIRQQLIVTTGGTVPCAIPLGGGIPSSNVKLTQTGRLPNGPWQVAFQWKLPVSLDIPELREEGLVARFGNETVLESGGDTTNVDAQWMSHVLKVMTANHSKIIATYWVTDEAWQDALKETSHGRSPAKLKLTKLNKYLEKRLR